MKTCIYTILILCIFNNLGFAQNKWLNYTNKYNVTELEEVDEGLWIGSQGGLCYINSTSGEEICYNRGNSDIPSNIVNDMLVLPNDDVWITTSLGICLLSNNTFIKGPEKIRGQMRLTPDNKVVVANYDSLYIQVSDMEFKSIAYPSYMAELGGLEIDNEGNIYLNAINYFAETYVAVYKNDSWNILFSEYVYNTGFAMDSNEKLWFAYSNGLHYWKDGEWILVSTFDDVTNFSTDRLHITKDNHVLIESNVNCSRLILWDGSSMSELDFIQGDCEDCQFIKPSSKKNDVYYARNRNLGYYSFTSTEKNDFQTLSQSRLYSNYVLTTLHPNDDSHIIVSYDNIQRIKGNEWTFIPVPNELNGNIKYAYLRSGNIYLCDNESIWYYDNDQWNSLEMPTLGFSGQIKLMYIADNDDIWIQYGTYVARYQNEWEVFGTIQHGIPTSIFKDIIMDENGIVWFSTFQGLHSYDGETWENFEIPPINQAFNLVATNDGVILRTSKLLHLKGDIIDTILLPPVGYYGQFESEMIYDLEKERLYLGGTHHLAVYENNEWTVHSTLNSGVYNGYSSDLNLDNKGNLWLSGSNGGLGVFNPEGIVLYTDKEANLANEPLIEIFPTCVSHSTINITSKHSGKFDVRLLDINGKMIDQKRIFIPREYALEYSLPNCPSGMYFLSFHRKGKQITKKIVVISK